MKQKGFTLTELIGVIVLLGFVALIAVPIISSTINKSKDKSYNNQISSLENTAKKWAVENTSLLPSDGNSCNLSLDNLRTEGFLADDIVVNPKDNTTMIGVIEISYDSTSKTYHYEYKEIKDNLIPNCIN